MCVKRVINETINQEVLQIIVTELELLHRARSTLGKLSTFASEQLVNRLETATVLGDCVMDYVRTAFCHRCAEKPVPLCLQTCNALGRGCYSPYYTALKAQHNDLWTEAKCVLRLINDTVMNILMSESKLLDLQTLVRKFDNTHSLVYISLKRVYTLQCTLPRPPQHTHTRRGGSKFRLVRQNCA